MSRIERWLQENFDRVVQVFPGQGLRCDYVVYKPRHDSPPRFVATDETGFSVRRVILAAAGCLFAILPWLLPVVYYSS